MGDLAGADLLLRRALEASERTLGKDHPDTLGSCFCLGALLNDMGDLPGAEAMLQRAVEGYTRTLGAAHPNTRNAVDWLKDIQADLVEEQRA